MNNEIDVPENNLPVEPVGEEVVVPEISDEPIETKQEEVKGPVLVDHTGKRNNFVESDVDPRLCSQRLIDLAPTEEEGTEEIANRLTKRMFPNSSDTEELDFIENAETIAALDANGHDYNTVVGPLRNFIKDADGRISGITKFTHKLTKGKLDANDIALAISSDLDSNQVLQAPMVNSGFRLELSRIDADELVFLDQKLASNLGELGRSTLGAHLLYTNVYLRRDITNVILRNVRRTNVKGLSPKNTEKIRQLLRPADLKTLMTLVVAAQHIDGFLIAAPCSGPTCTNVHTGKVNVQKMMHVDHGKLTDRQLEIISRPMSEQVTEEEIEEYQGLFPTPEPFEMESGTQTYRLNFADRSLDSDLALGVTWINGISKAIDSHVNSTDDIETVTNVTRAVLNNNSLTNFLGYVGSIDVIDKATNDVITVTDQDAINGVLKSARNSKYFQDLYERLNEVVFDDPVVIGIHPKACTCGHRTPDALVPVDMLTEFFTRLLTKQTAMLYYAIPL